TARAMRVFTAGRIVMPGNLGVSLFYSISAFLITFLACREWQNDHQFSCLRFYIRRVLRIWPLFLFMLLVTSFHGARTGHLFDALAYAHFKAHAWQFMLFINNWSMYPERHELNILWSIAV